jgi:hypothetical protein
VFRTISSEGKFEGAEVGGFVNGANAVLHDLDLYNVGYSPTQLVCMPTWTFKQKLANLLFFKPDMMHVMSPDRPYVVKINHIQTVSALFRL